MRRRQWPLRACGVPRRAEGVWPGQRPGEQCRHRTAGPVRGVHRGTLEPGPGSGPDQRLSLRAERPAAVARGRRRDGCQHRVHRRAAPEFYRECRLCGSEGRCDRADPATGTRTGARPDPGQLRMSRPDQHRHYPAQRHRPAASITGEPDPDFPAGRAGRSGIRDLLSGLGCGELHDRRDRRRQRRSLLTHDTSTMR